MFSSHCGFNDSAPNPVGARGAWLWHPGQATSLAPIASCLNQYEDIELMPGSCSEAFPPRVSPKRDVINIVAWFIALVQMNSSLAPGTHQ